MGFIVFIGFIGLIGLIGFMGFIPPCLEVFRAWGVRFSA